ncbi:MAG TPA: BBP7 family outer membrane beta-barrel protein [Gemmataceae bacterium]|nr:BBP7 family outer membrane beta-barrel protein [Gemmataceae bacterium]
MLPAQNPDGADKGKEPEKKQPAADPGKQGQAQGCQNTQNQNTQNTQNQPTEEEKRAALLRLDHSGPCESVWFKGGFLLWWLRSAPPTGPLVTTGGPNAGILNNPDTQILLGNDRFNFSGQTGITLEAGVWLDELHQWGLSASGFLLERTSQGTLFQSNAAGVPLLARPFTNVTKTTPSKEDSLVVAAPGVAAGTINVWTNTQLWGAELNIFRNLVYTPQWNIHVLAGFRYLDLRDDLNIFQSSTRFTDGTTEVADRFTTRNQLYLGEVGATFEWAQGPFIVDLWSKVGLGPNHERGRNLGETLLPGAANAVPGGLLALPPTATLSSKPGLPVGNFGVHRTDWFVIVPEVGLDVGLQVTDHLRLSAGYSFLYINNVIRPGNQVNLNVNPSLVPSATAFGSPSGAGQPSVLTKTEDFWAHGLRVMIEFRF